MVAALRVVVAHDNDGIAVWFVIDGVAEGVTRFERRNGELVAIENGTEE